MSPFLNGKGLFYKKMPHRSGAIFSGSIFLFYGFVDSDACDFWIGLDLVFLLDWILLTFGLGLDLAFRLEWISVF